MRQGRFVQYKSEGLMAYGLRGKQCRSLVMKEASSMTCGQWLSIICQ